MADLYSDEYILLATKIQLPPIQTTYLPRPRIEALLNDAITHPLTVISAPAGYGKTTAIIQWLRSQHDAYSWLALDDMDNDPARFWRYFTATLSFSPMQLPYRPDIYRYLDNMLNQIAESAHPIFLILDDVHVIHQHDIHHALAYVVEHTPPNFHIILSSRTDMPFSIAHLRARGNVAEIHSDDLRFTLPESIQYLREIHHLDISDHDIQELFKRTDGWCAALLMAVLSWQSMPKKGSVIHEFSGHHRYMVSFLADVVLAHETEQVRGFLTSIAVLQRFNVELCMAVTGYADASALLEYIEKANLLVIPLDESHTWYRLHPLMSEYLQSLLQRTDPQSVRDLLQHAMEWFAGHGYDEEAIHYALAAQAYCSAIPLIIRYAPTKIVHGEMLTLFQWLNAIPQPLLLSHPQLTLLLATILINNGQLDDAEKYTHITENLLTDQQKSGTYELVPLETANGIHGTLGEVYGARAIIASFRGHVQKALEYTQQAILLLPETNNFVHSVMLTSLAAAYWWSGDVNRAREAFHESWGYAVKEHMPQAIITSLSGEGFAIFAQGRYNDALVLFNDAVRQSTTPANIVLPVATIAYIGMGAIYREWGDFSTAQTLLEKGLQISAEWGDIGMILYGELQLARIHQIHGGLQKSYERVRALEQAIIRMDANHYMSTIASAYAFFALAMGDTQKAEQWARSLLPRQGEAITYLIEYEWLIALHVFVALHCIDEAAICFNQIEEPAHIAGRFNNYIEIMMLKALWWNQQGHTDAALECLADVLRDAEPNKYLSIFLTEGEPMRLLLEQLQQRNPPTSAYIATILARFPPTSTTQIIEPVPLPFLNQREYEILKLVAEGLENKAIAERLIVAPSTIKWHMKHIFLKLHAHSRTQAIAHAREYGIL